MAKAIYMSVIFAPVILPAILAARARDAKRGVRQVQKYFLVFSILYVLALVYVVPRLQH